MIITGLDLSINSSGCVKFWLDDNLNIVEKNYLGFNQVKKNTNENIIHYKPDEFKNDYEKYDWMLCEILNFVDNSEYVALEGYSFGSKGMIFNIAEWTGILKYNLFMNDIKFRTYPPSSIKMFATDNGSSDKLGMEEAYNKEKNTFDLSFLPEYKSPKSDIIDAFYIAKLLQTELKLRNGLLDIKILSKKQQRVFTQTSKSESQPLLEREFLGR